MTPESLVSRPAAMVECEHRFVFDRDWWQYAPGSEYTSAPRSEHVALVHCERCGIVRQQLV